MQGKNITKGSAYLNFFPLASTLFCHFRFDFSLIKNNYGAKWIMSFLNTKQN